MSKQIRVLVFDDEVTILKLLRYVLEARGYEVFTFLDPSFCPLHCQDSCKCGDSCCCADIIISDIRMFSVDGLSFIKNQIEKGCKVKPSNIAILSGYWIPEVAEEMSPLGIKGFQKPFFIDELEKWLDECEKNIDSDRNLIDSSILDIDR